MIDTLRQRDFLLAWLGGLVSMIGDWALIIALPVYIYQLTGSTLATSGMLAAEIVPALLFGSVAGVFVDRWDRKRTMIVANLAMAATLVPLLAVHSADLIWLAYIAGFAQATIVQFFRPAENALLPRLVDADRLLTANALNSLNNNLAQLFGSALGGAAMGLFGITGVVLVDVATFLAASMLIARIGTSGTVEHLVSESDRIVQRAWQRVLREWLDGIAQFRHNGVVKALISLQGVAALGEGVMGVMFVVWVNDVLDGGARELGWLMSAQAVGGLLGGALLGSFVPRQSPVRVFGIGSIVFGLLDLALFNYPAYLSGIWLGIVIIGLVGIPTIGMGAGFMTMLQQSVRDAWRGRLFGLMGTTSALMRLTGTMIAGALGGILGPIVLLNIQGGAYVLMGLLALAALPNLLARGSGNSKPTSPEPATTPQSPGVQS